MTNRTFYTVAFAALLGFLLFLIGMAITHPPTQPSAFAGTFYGQPRR